MLPDAWIPYACVTKFLGVFVATFLGARVAVKWCACDAWVVMLQCAWNLTLLRMWVAMCES